MPSLAADAATDPAALPPPTFRLLGLGYVPDMRYDLKGKPRTVQVSQDTYSEAYPIPADGVLSFYRLSPAPNPADPPIKKTVVQTRIEHPDHSAIILLIRDPQAPQKPYTPPPGNPDDPSYNPLPPTIDPMVAFPLDDSPSAHPVATVRVISLSRRTSALKIGPNLSQVAPLQNLLVPYPSDPRTWLHVAVYGDRGWQRIIGGPQSFAPGTRITLVLSDLPPEKYSPNPDGLALKKIIETIPP
ncbi:MAG TPA: hypothetical protein VK968_14780, partial [Roseimicrobium sp.]|nr:hypothetical protein [Roseimicrobium sp.]